MFSELLKQNLPSECSYPSEPSPISLTAVTVFSELSPSEGEQVLFLALLRGLASAVSHCHRMTMAVLQAVRFPQAVDGGDLGFSERAHT